MGETSIDKTFLKIVTESGIPLKKLAEATSCKSSEILKWWNQHHTSNCMKYSHLRDFAQYFGMKEEALIDNTYNKSLLRKRFLGKKTDLPDYYEENANSYIRSSFYIIEYLNMLYGQAFTDELLKELNVHPLYFEDLNKKISILFVNDLFKKCRELGFTDSHFENLAGSMYLSLEQNDLESLFEDVSCYESFFIAFEQLCRYFDHNFTSVYKIGRSGFTLTEKPSDEVLGYAKKGQLDLDFIQYYRGLLIKHSPKMGQLNCVHPSLSKIESGSNLVTTYNVRYSSSHLSATMI